MLELQEENKAGVTDEEIMPETNLFIAAGYDTVASVLQWLLLRIGCDLDVQQKMQREIDELFELDKNKSLTSGDLRQLEYTEMVIKEVMRLHPALPILMRYLDTSLKLDESTTIPKGVVVFMFLLGLHRDHSVYPNPDEFIPDRFSKEEISKRHPFAHAPFFLGPRGCPGNKFAMFEMKMIIAHTLRNFSVKSIQKQDQFASEFSGVSRPKGGVHVELIPRH